MKKTVIITMEQIAIESNLRPGSAKDKPWRQYIAERFKREHGCIVVSFEKLRYLKDDHGRDEMHVVGLCGDSISYPQQ